MAFLDLAGEVFLGEPFEGGFQGGAAGVGVEEGGVDYEGVGEFEGGEVGVEGVPDEDGGWGEEGEEAGLDDWESGGYGGEGGRGDAGVAGRSG